MPAKSNASKKKPASMIRKAPAPSGAKPRAPSAKSGVYVRVAGLKVVVTDEKPAAGAARGPFTSPSEARGAAIDELVTAIEAAERQLVAIRRAATLEQIRAAAKSEE